MEEKYIDIIRRRVRHLRDRIATSNKDLSFDKAEVSALEWALDIIAKYFVLISKK